MNIKAMTKPKVSMEEFVAIKTTFLNVFTTVIMEDIPEKHIINWDHTALLCSAPIETE